MNTRLSTINTEQQVTDINSKRRIDKLRLAAVIGISLAIVFFVLFFIVLIVGAKKKKGVSGGGKGK